MRKVDEFGNIEIKADGKEQDYVYNLTEKYVMSVGTAKRADRYFQFQDVTVSVIGESEKAIQFKIVSTGDVDILDEGETIEDVAKKVWLPKSVLTLTEDGYEMEAWVVKNNGLRDYVVSKKYKD